MAVVTSHLATTIRGSVGGATYYSRPSTPIILKARRLTHYRLHVVPQVGNNPFLEVTQLYYSLDDDRLAGWRSYAKQTNFPRKKGGFGKTAKSAFATITTRALYLYYSGIIDTKPNGDPPEYPGMLPINIGFTQPLDVAGDGFKLIVDSGADQNVAVWAWTTIAYKSTRRYMTKRWDYDSLQAAIIGEDERITIRWTDRKPGCAYGVEVWTVSAQNPFSIGYYLFQRALATHVD